MKTYRNRLRDRPQRGRGVESVIKTINSIAVEPVIVNPESKFVVVTYWWGRDNINANLQRPCPEDLLDPVRKRIVNEEIDKDPALRAFVERNDELEAKRWDYGDPLTDEEAAELKEFKDGLKKILEYQKKLFTRDDVKARLVTGRQEEIAKLTAEGKFKPGRSYAAMIREWEDKLRAANCNYFAANTEFPGGRDDYQHAINGKPVFIKKCLDALKDKGMGVLYIDGDMFIHEYPHIFDMENVDFMARGWNVDPRDVGDYRSNGGRFNPYIFETSGGTMYFGNTESARKILDKWIAISADPAQAGKADDRLLSMVYTADRMVVGTSIIQLPIEYLWLTDKYAPRFGAKNQDAVAPGLIEHPACLTGEERATEGSTVKDRQPAKYYELEDAMEANVGVPGGRLYEYIYFASPEMAEGMRPWLEYFTRIHSTYPNKGFEIVPYNDRYGEFSEIADKNTQEAADFKLTPKGRIVDIARTAPISEILAYLTNGFNVSIPGLTDVTLPNLGPDIDFVAFNRGTLGSTKTFMPVLEIETNGPMFLRAGNSVLLDLIRMCKTIEDINIHLRGSYMFLSRIRWKVVPAKYLKQ